MKTVLIIYKYFARGGAQCDLARTARALLERQAEVTVLCAELSDPLPEGCRHVLLPSRGFSNHARLKHFEKQVTEYLSSHEFDVSVGFTRMKNLDIYFAADDCLRSRWKNSLLNVLLPRRRTFLAMEAAALRSDLILTLTGRQETDYRRFYRTSAERFKRLPPGIDRKYQTADRSRSQLRQEVCEQYNIDPDKFIIVQAAASFHTKGVDRALAMLNTLPAKLKKNIVYLVCGDDRRRSNYAKLASTLAFEIRFPGGVDTLEKVYMAGDLMLHPARAEATGTVLIEAMCCGLPMLTTNRCGYAEYVEASGGGVVLPEPFNLDHWVLALKKLLTEPEHLEQCRKNLQHLYKNEFWYSRTQVIADEIIRHAETQGENSK